MQAKWEITFVVVLQKSSYSEVYIDFLLGLPFKLYDLGQTYWASFYMLLIRLISGLFDCKSEMLHVLSLLHFLTTFYSMTSSVVHLEYSFMTILKLEMLL